MRKDRHRHHMIKPHRHHLIKGGSISDHHHSGHHRHSGGSVEIKDHNYHLGGSLGIPAPPNVAPINTPVQPGTSIVSSGFQKPIGLAKPNFLINDKRKKLSTKIIL